MTIDLAANLGAQRLAAERARHRHRWSPAKHAITGDSIGWWCACGAIKDEQKSKVARNNRKRGGAWELEASRHLAVAFPDSRKTGPLGGPDDVIAGPLYGQAKAVASLYPKRLDDLLSDAERHCTADQYPALLLKHPGHERRHKLIVMDLLDFVSLVARLHGEDAT